MKKIFIIITGLILLGNTRGYSQCACCSSVGCGDNSGGGSSLVKQGKWLFNLAGRYTSFKPLSQQQIQKDAAADTSFSVYNKSSQYTYTLSLTYGITNRLNATLTLPYSSITNIQLGSAGDASAINQGTSKGFSNLKASIQYVLLQRQYCAGWEVIPNIGLIAPTGIHNNVALDGTQFDDQFQPGADAWVPVVGLSVDNMFGKITLRGNFNYVFANTDPQGNTDAALWNADVSAYRTVFKSGGCTKPIDTTKTMVCKSCESICLISVFAGGQLEHVGQDIVAMPDGSKAFNSNIGAFRTYVNAGIVANLWHQFFIPVSFALPVYQSENGYQVKVNWRLNAGLALLL